MPDRRSRNVMTRLRKPQRTFDSSHRKINYTCNQQLCAYVYGVRRITLRFVIQINLE